MTTFVPCVSEGTLTEHTNLSVSNSAGKINSLKVLVQQNFPFHCFAALIPHSEGDVGTQSHEAGDNHALLY